MNTGDIIHKKSVLLRLDVTDGTKVVLYYLIEQHKNIPGKSKKKQHFSILIHKYYFVVSSD